MLSFMVNFKFNDNLSEDEKDGFCKELEEINSQADMVVSCVSGRHSAPPRDGFTHAVNMMFKSEDDWNAWKASPFHEQTKNIVHPNTADRFPVILVSTK